ncbi:hypothetical protein ONS95_001299 [Cadophora gregata]|uniref:uncharacterized protein n=1 Tax=Cadophora gregata TaxID=51156 RepID=UPI0026DBEFE4|nr:uncharacterized protein ONS95_001299 [Cadophora gregata]KAK0101889.1 hypothetical protein ONS96_005864 [Cadophora gregata f. sp. sojae]KAK0129373.1 hypothetical protein ONS95_001299 [Cadophora gregata]
MDRQKLYRVGRLTQELFLIFREITWCQLKISAVTKNGNDLIVHGKKMQNACWPQGYFAFPSKLVPEVDDRNALLCFLACREAIPWEIEFADGLLGAMVKETTRIRHWHKKGNRNMRLVQPSPGALINGANLCHEMIKLTLHSGESYAFDVTGFQYGYPNPITPWNEYRRERLLGQIEANIAPKARELVRVDDFSYETMIHYGIMVDTVKKDRRDGAGDTIEAMNFDMLEWQANGKISMEELWKLRDANFDVMLTDLVNFIHWKMSCDLGQPWSTVHGKELTQTLQMVDGFIETEDLSPVIVVVGGT